LFAKNPKLLRRYSVPTSTRSKHAPPCWERKGGIKINERMEVLDSKCKAIPGLYAGGFDAGGMYGDSYPIHVSSGLSSAFAINSGRIAGRTRCST
jgi:fumarate reductase flavoprotein subunit